MPIAHSLKKVSKNVGKSQGTMHIKGRKFKQLNRATLREKKLTDRKARTATQKENDMALYYFLQLVINEEMFKEYETFPFDKFKGLVEMHVMRHDDDLEEFRAQRRPGRPMTSKHQILEEKAKHDAHLWETGIKVPNLMDKDTVHALRNWNGTTGGATVFKMVEISLRTSDADNMEE